MRYIIMCGGVYHLWETPRHLLEINGEPIVARTIRLLKENGVDDIAISTNDPRFEKYAPILTHDNRYEAWYGNNGRWTDCFYPTEDPTCYIFGDVVFSPQAIKTIVETETLDIQFFASAPPFAPEYSKPYAEPFALKVVDQHHLRDAIWLTEVLSERGEFKRKPIMWELWQVLKCAPLNVIDYNSYVKINDYTCDVDSKDDLEKIRRSMI